MNSLLQKLLPDFVKKPVHQIRKSIISINELRDLIYQSHSSTLRHEHHNPLNACGQKCFSQTDEDGITIEILKRIGSLDSGSFAEFGVGDGTENNTLVLKALGWKGFWAGGEDLSFEVRQPETIFKYFKTWITLDNASEIARDGMKCLGITDLDVMSLDLDGNDYYLVENLLKNGFLPKLFIVEYNGKFIPPIRWKIRYDPGHVWRNDDYFGASLASFVDLFTEHGYRLVCCNAQTGANAFFIQEKYSHLFDDVPGDIYQLYVPPRYHLYKQYGHKQSLKTISDMFA